MNAIEERLSPSDATFSELEQADEGAMMHIGGALIFDPQIETGGAPSLERLRALLEERLGKLPRFRRRLAEPRVHGLRRPRWVEDPSFDLRAHLRHATLPAPSGNTELHEWLSDFWSHRLDRARPLWEMALVDGLEDGGWMLATKTHHAMVDGVASIDIGHILFDAEPHPAPRTLAKPPTTNELDRSGLHLPDWLPSRVAAQIARVAIDAARHPRQLMHAGEAAVAMGEMVWQGEIMAARRSTLNVPIGTTRRFASVVFELAQIREVKLVLGGTVNDVVLAIAAGALRRLLQHRGEELDQPLRAMVPVNLRGEDHDSLGNQVSSPFVELPIGEPDTRRRYEPTRAAAT
jgi:diacylglycerol O-acyltransferase / wax synthase